MVRPQKIYDAFLKMGHEVKLLSGTQSTRFEKVRQRNLQIREVNAWLKKNTPDLCYIESSTYPILNPKDISLIKCIHRKGIPIGYFFRDAYYKFKSEANIIPKSATQMVKSIALNWLYARDERVIKKFVDIVYFPTIKMSTYFNFSKMNALPPAGENHLQMHQLREEKTCIYVGGIEKIYGGDLLLEGFSILNQGEQKCKLILVCRESELKNVNPLFLQEGWCEIHHASGEDELYLLYKRADIALLPRAPGVYNDFSISVKLFEYLSHGLPIVAMYAEEMAKIIESYRVGLITPSNPVKFAAAIEMLFNDSKMYNEFVSNVRGALLSENLWTHRIKKITEDLTAEPEKSDKRC